MVAGMSEPFFITTAIDYTNAPPHIGHAYEKILADVLARYHRLKGDQVFFLTGVDQHGQKVQQAAAKEGLEPQAFVDDLSGKFTELWEKLDIQYDGWAATTNPLHKQCVQQILQGLFDKGEIYKAPYTGFYSERQEQFLTDKERGPDGVFGAEWGNVVELQEENWYFKLSQYKDWLVNFIRNTPGLVTPEYRQRELLNAAEKMEGDLSISRPKARLTWGIELPFDTNCVTYVWFDALVNYISFAGFDAKGGDVPSQIASGKFLWPQLHVIGKDIIIPAHGVYWLCMLKAMGFSDAQMPRFLVHGYIMVDGEKMSKTLGNVRDPHTFADKFGVEAVRYYLMRDCGVGADMDFTDERLTSRYNSDLANSLGNLMNRSLSMTWKYRDGKISNSEFRNTDLEEHQNVIATHLLSSDGGFQSCFEKCKVDTALGLVNGIAQSANGLVEKSAPWALAKDPEKAEQLDAVLYALVESLRIIAILISPVLPKAAAGIFSQLNWDQLFSLADAQWGGLPDGHVVAKPTPLFPRIENPAAV